MRSIPALIRYRYSLILTNNLVQIQELLIKFEKETASHARQKKVKTTGQVLPEGVKTDRKDEINRNKKERKNGTENNKNSG